MADNELAWAAGFFDGEGYSARKAGKYPHIGITQKERTVLDRFAAAVGAGKVYGPYCTHNVRFQYHLQGARAVRCVFDRLNPYLSEPKREQFERTLY